MANKYTEDEVKELKKMTNICWNIVDKMYEDDQYKRNDIYYILQKIEEDTGLPVTDWLY